MAAPKGSKNALGNKGGGRKTLRDELAQRQELQELWDEFKPKFRKLGIKGNTSILNAVFGKNFSDKLEIETPKQTEAIEQLTEQVKQMINDTRSPKNNLS